MGMRSWHGLLYTKKRRSLSPATLLPPSHAFLPMKGREAGSYHEKASHCMSPVLHAFLTPALQHVCTMPLYFIPSKHEENIAF